jgi:uncharacterized protein YjbI with pentapeptide repeats
VDDGVRPLGVRRPDSWPGFADIRMYHTGQIIPGTQGITPAPGIDLSGWNTPGHDLESANLQTTDLTNASFAASDLTSAEFAYSTLSNVNFSAAIVKGADFYGTTGFIASQLYSTAGYTRADLTGIGLGGIDLTGWNFASQNLTSAGREDEFRKHPTCAVKGMST